ARHVTAVLCGDLGDRGASLQPQARARRHGLDLLPTVHRVKDLLRCTDERSVAWALREPVSTGLPTVLLGEALVLPAGGDLGTTRGEGAVAAGGVAVDEQDVAVVIRGVVRVAFGDGEDLRPLTVMPGERGGHRSVHELPGGLRVNIPG